MNKVIGIISYLPDDTNIRKNRLNSFKELITSCNHLFNLPIYVVIQNYSTQEILELQRIKNITLSINYPRLGILSARRTLREWFLNSDYDYLIMLDDDCHISGTSAKEYLKQIDDNPDCFIEFNQTLLKLFAISKNLFRLIDYDNVNPELEEGFEDRIFVNKLRKLFKENRRVFKESQIKLTSVSSKDSNSTWYINQNLKEMLEKTEKYLC